MPQSKHLIALGFQRKVGKQLRREMVDAEISVRRLAEKIDISHASIIRMRAGKQPIDMYTLCRLAQALDIWPPQKLITSAMYH